MRIVDQSVQNGIRQSGVGHRFVPLFNRILTGGNRGSHGIAVVKEFNQVLLMQLGAQYPFCEEVWPEICQCVLSRFRGQPLLPMTDEDIVTEADRIVRVLLKRHGGCLISARLVSQDTARWRLIDINDQEQMDSRTVGVEQLALWALQELRFGKLLLQLGLTRAMRRAII